MEEDKRDLDAVKENEKNNKEVFPSPGRMLNYNFQESGKKYKNEERKVTI